MDGMGIMTFGYVWVSTKFWLLCRFKGPIIQLTCKTNA